MSRDRRPVLLVGAGFLASLLLVVPSSGPPIPTLVGGAFGWPALLLADAVAPRAPIGPYLAADVVLYATLVAVTLRTSPRRAWIVCGAWFASVGIGGIWILSALADAVVGRT